MAVGPARNAIDDGQAMKRMVALSDDGTVLAVGMLTLNLTVAK